MKGVRSFLDYIFQEVVRLLFDSKSLNPSLLKIVHRLESLCYPVPPGQPISRYQRHAGQPPSPNRHSVSAPPPSRKVKAMQISATFPYETVAGSQYFVTKN